MITAAVAAYLPTVIDTLTYAPTSTGGNVFVGAMPDRPDIAVGLFAGVAAEQATKSPSDEPGLQVITRGVQHDVVDAYALARAIYSALNCLDGVVLDPSGDDEVFVIGCTANQSDPAPLGPDVSGRHEWSQNFSFRVHAPTVHRPAVNPV